MATTTSFETAALRVAELLGDRNLGPAYQAATRLVDEFGSQARSCYLLNLAVCLSNRGGGAKHAERFIAQARGCADWTPQITGDMQRDRVIGLSRFGRGPADLKLADELLAITRQLHSGDRNRQACLDDVAGRLAYARHDYPAADKLHAQAADTWHASDNEANPVWVYNNLVHWLKAAVALRGRHSEHALNLLAAIRCTRLVDAPDRTREAKVIMLPGGNWLHDLALRHR